MAYEGMRAKHWVLVVLIIALAITVILVTVDLGFVAANQANTKVNVEIVRACQTLPLDARTVCLQHAR